MTLQLFSLVRAACSLWRRLRPASLAGLVWAGGLPLAAQIGADLPWTTVEAEAMQGTAQVFGPAYGPHTIESESSGQRAVKLATPGDHVEFVAPVAADALVVRYSLPDVPSGGGRASSLTLSVNGQARQTLALSSRNAWLYGAYPFSNDPQQGKPRNFYDELRLKGLELRTGDRIRLEKTDDDGAAVVLDLVDLEQVPAPVARPEHALSIRDLGARGDGRADDTEALRQAVARAQTEGGVVWVPPGDYLITGDIVVPSGVTIQGAGMWHTTFRGDPGLYHHADRRVRFKLVGANAHLTDFAIFGQLNYRNDQEANDGVVGDGCTDATVRRLWIEHTKAGVWVYNGTRLVIEGCRFRNLIADGVNLCVGTRESVVENCTARGTGDDCFAIWPAPADQGYDGANVVPGNNVIRRCTGQLTFLANGGALYGGANNRIEDCRFTDIGTGCGILISTTFPTADEARGIDHTFSGETVVRNVQLERCGGYDHSWAWRGSLQICLDRRSISGLRIRGVEIRDSFSDGITVVAPGRDQGQGTLADSIIEDVSVETIGLGSGTAHALNVRADVTGGIALVDSPIHDIRNEAQTFEITRR